MEVHLIRSPEAEARHLEEALRISRLALPDLEKERQAKTIGKALEAKVTLTGYQRLVWN